MAAYHDADSTLVVTDTYWDADTALTAPRVYTLPSPVGHDGLRIPFTNSGGGINDTNYLTFNSAAGVNRAGMAMRLRRPFAQLDFVSNNVIWLCDNAAESRRNLFPNPTFDAWVGPTTVAAPANTFFDALWKVNNTAGRTFSRQAGFGGANYCIRLQRDAGNANNAAVRFALVFPTETALACAGKTVNISADMRCGADFSAVLGVKGNLCWGSLADEFYDINGIHVFVTGEGHGNDNWLIPSTTANRYYWQRYAVSSSARAMAAFFDFVNASSASGAADYLEITKFKLAIAETPDEWEFEPYTPSLNATNRLYERLGGDVSNNIIGDGYADSQLHAFITLRYAQKYRTPTPVLGGALTDYVLKRQGGHSVPISAVTPITNAVGLTRAKVDVTVPTCLIPGEFLTLESANTNGAVYLDSRF